MRHLFNMFPDVFGLGFASDGIVTHLALHASRVPFAPTGHDTFGEDFVQNRLVEPREVLRGE